MSEDDYAPYVMPPKNKKYAAYKGEITHSKYNNGKTSPRSAKAKESILSPKSKRKSPK